MLKYCISYYCYSHALMGLVLSVFYSVLLLFSYYPVLSIRSDYLLFVAITLCLHIQIIIQLCIISPISMEWLITMGYLSTILHVGTYWHTWMNCPHTVTPTSLTCYPNQISLWYCFCSLVLCIRLFARDHGRARDRISEVSQIYYTYLFVGRDASQIKASLHSFTSSVIRARILKESSLKLRPQAYLLSASLGFDQIQSYYQIIFYEKLFS